MRRILSKLSWSVLGSVTSVLVFLIAIGSYSWWWPWLSNGIDRTLAAQRGSSRAEPIAIDVPHAALTELELTPQARLNLGLTADYVRPVELSTFQRSITVPAVVIAKPGRASIIVSSPLNGVVTHVHAVTGEAVLPGELLLEVRLTYEDLVETQTAYLKTISELEVESREIARLEQATQSGAISGRALLERRYAKEKLEAFVKSQREALRMHGLSDRQIDEIGTDGKLMRDLQIVAPDVDIHDHDDELRLSRLPARTVVFTHALLVTQLETPRAGDKPEHAHPLVIDSLEVHKGQAIMAGERLCSLSDYTQLYIEGKAFENDIAAITAAAQRDWTVEAIFSGSGDEHSIGGLKLAYVSNSIDTESRTLSMYVELPNEIVRDETNGQGQRFLAWKYRLGQRLELRVPVEQWQDQIVLPVEAVVKEGADWFVFQQNGKVFTRVPVHVRYRDQNSVVIANDGAINPGDFIALRAAHQMQMAIKNMTGGAADPHAGHTH